MKRNAVITLFLTTAVLCNPVFGQWLHYLTPGLPRNAKGDPILTAPAPRLSNGTPDISGIWRSEQPAKRTTDSGAAIMNLENALAPGSAISMTPSTEAIYRDWRLHSPFRM
jgi:hypothetical protein